MARKKEEVYEEEEEYEEVEETKIDENQEMINMIKHQILDEMKNHNPTSEQYKECLQRLVDIGDYERNVAATKRDDAETVRSAKETEQLEHQKYAWFLPTVFQTGAQCLTQIAIAGVQSCMNRKNLKTVVGYENSGEIINSKGLGFIDKKH